MTSRFSQVMIGLTLAVLAIHTALTARLPDSLGPTRAAIQFEQTLGGAEPFTEASPHILPRLTLTAAVYRDAPAERCYITTSLTHAHVYCPQELDAVERGVTRPAEVEPVWRASLTRAAPRG